MSDYGHRKWTQALWITGLAQGGAVVFHLWQQDWPNAAVMAVNFGCWTFLIWALCTFQKSQA